MDSKRAGALRRVDISSKALQSLNLGEVASKTLVEALAVDFAVLMEHGVPGATADDVQKLRVVAAQGITKRMKLAAELLSERFGEVAFDRLFKHPSDTVRGWAAFVVGADAVLSLDQKIERIKPLANDSHFCVREWAWLGLRPALTADIATAIHLLIPWSESKEEYSRRFAIEATRPRGVWSPHIRRLKAEPELARPLLDNVMMDSSRYVQNACGNWLNDAAKDNPAWVFDYCDEWRQSQPCGAVSYITRSGLRSLYRPGA